MRIGIDCHHLKDQKGIESYVIGLLAYFKTEELISFILYFQNGDKKIKKIPKSNNFLIKEIKNFLPIQSTAIFQHYLLPKQAKKDKLNILFSPSYFLPLFYKGTTALTIHDIIYEAHPEWFNRRKIKDKFLTKWIGKKSARKANVIFTPSKFTKDEIIKHYKINSNKIKITAVASDNIKKTVNKKTKINFLKLKKKFEIKDNFFFFPAALFPRRCILEMVGAFKKIAEQHKNFQLLIIGKDFSGENTIEAISSINSFLKRKAIIYIADFIERREILALYDLAYVTVYLSLYEGFGLPVLESMTYGTPVITGNAKSLLEITNKKCFWVENPKSIDEVFEKMKLSIDDDMRYKKYVNEGLKKAKNFSWEKCAKETLKFFNLQN